MKVLFCETYDDGTVGGSHACMYNLVRRMDRSEFRFTVGLCSRNVYAPRYEKLGVDVVMLPRRRPWRMKIPVVRKALNWYRLEHSLQRCVERLIDRRGFDLVVLNNSVFVSLPYIRACRKAGVPVVVYERGIGYFLKRHIRATPEISAAIPISEAVAEYLRRNGYRAETMRVIYDGIDPAEFESPGDPGKIKASIGVPREAKTIGIVGNLRPWKGQQHFVQALLTLAAEREDVYGLVIGAASDEDREYETGLKRKVADAGMEDRLRFLGYRDDVVRLLGILDIFVHASERPEPFGMVLLEAMAARCPVVATALGGPLEIIGEGACGILVPPGDPAAIAEACKKYLGDAELMRRVSASAHARLLEKFDIRNTVEQTARLFRSTAGAR